MNTRDIFSHEHDHWKTPEDLRVKLYAELSLNYDPCLLFCKTDCLVVDWSNKRVFCNPPYSNIGAFLAKWREPEISVYLLPSRTGTKWFHEIVLPHAREIRFLRGRLRFGGSKINAPFDSMIVVFGR
jgi:DNA N-6-adenine-methyltransferase (Dam)